MSAEEDANLEATIPPPSVEDSAQDTSLDASAQRSAELDKKLGELRIANLQQDMEARREYANKLYRLIIWWLSGIGLLIVLQGFTFDFVFWATPSGSSSFKDFFPISFSLSDKVFIAILTGTTVNVLGLFLVVARYFYKSKEKD
ncbi:MAG: hypothetical protein OXH81_13615 [Gemmatimonadetes bacterium]|nr:hypothetical protein [Gemmatimonadota bacterium]